MTTTTHDERATDVMLPALRPWRLSLEHASDTQFDVLLPRAARRASSRYWTPVRVARRAAGIFEELGVSRVLDVGSGSGKLCVVAGLHAPRLELVGVEQRPHLVAAARALALAVGTTNVTFVQGDATLLPSERFDGFYVFNSFAENGLPAADQLDQTVELSHVRRLDDVMRVQQWLATRTLGTILVTYHGLGGPIPASYEHVHMEAAGSGWLHAWRQGCSSANNDKQWLEDGPAVSLATLEEIVHHLLPGEGEGVHARCTLRSV